MDPTPAKRMKMQDNPADVNKQPEEDYSTVTHGALQSECILLSLCQSGVQW